MEKHEFNGIMDLEELSNLKDSEKLHIAFKFGVLGKLMPEYDVHGYTMFGEVTRVAGLEYVDKFFSLLTDRLSSSAVFDATSILSVCSRLGLVDMLSVVTRRDSEEAKRTPIMYSVRCGSLIDAESLMYRLKYEAIEYTSTALSLSEAITKLSEPDKGYILCDDFHTLERMSLTGSVYELNDITQRMYFGAGPAEPGMLSKIVQNLRGHSIEDLQTISLCDTDDLGTITHLLCISPGLWEPVNLSRRVGLVGNVSLRAVLSALIPELQVRVLEIPKEIDVLHWIDRSLTVTLRIQLNIDVTRVIQRFGLHTTNVLGGKLWYLDGR